MSFGGSFGGFGQNNNQQPQPSAFSGFGANNTAATTGFGGFGGTNNTTTGGAFGANAGAFGNPRGFGNNQNTGAFGARPSGFGATPNAGSNVFGNPNPPAPTGTAFGTFGLGNTAPATTTFGQPNIGGAFGNNTSAFGGNPGATSAPFGSANAGANAFGGTAGAFRGAPTTGIGGATPECVGTGQTAFQPFMEKEANSGGQQAFQSISFQAPYQKFSPEELRLADYNQGRRYGNASNQPGAFGTNSGFGGFGNNATTNNTGGFGGNNNAGGGGLFPSSTPFGTSQANTGFGNTATTGGIFANKPATGGTLFGTQAQTQPSGGVFGNTAANAFGANTNTGAFGTNNTPSAFGNNATANKPFNFGTAMPANNTGTIFGNTNTNTGGGAFGSINQTPSNPNPFGAAQQPATTNAFGSFGAQTNQTGTSTMFGGQNNQSKPGGIFGSTATTNADGLFANAQPAANPSSIFGTANTQNTGSGIFGNKPATGGGIFGTNANTQPNTGTGLFPSLGQNQNQPQQNSGSLFASLNADNQQKPSIFGNPQPQATGSLFGNNQPTQQQGSGLLGSLGNNQTQQPAQNSFFGGGNSLLGGSEQGQQAPQSLTASINDGSAYGSPSLFSSLSNSQQIRNPGPIATPLSGSVRQKKTSALPIYKLNPASASRYSATPQRHGYGFPYSSYSTPGSASSTASTPGMLSNSYLSNPRAPTLNKSMSTSNLRRTFTSQELILSPGAFSASPSTRQSTGAGSLKKLTISKSIRNDFFAQRSSILAQSSPLPNSILKKQVSFDSATIPEGTNGANRPSPLKQTQNSASFSSDESGYMRSCPSTNGSKTGESSQQPEMEEVRNNELAIVPEGENVVTADHPRINRTRVDRRPGHYYMHPSRAELERMSLEQLKHVEDFLVGRENVGFVRFDKPVDLTSIDLDRIFDQIVKFRPRQITVYPDANEKPKRGQGLNVPATIELEQMFFRSRNEREQNKERNLRMQIEVLKAQQDCEFKSYDPDKAVWTFKVQHFTTYGFGGEEESADNKSDRPDESTFSASPDTPTPGSRTKQDRMEQSFNSTLQMSRTESDPEDTFEFKNKKILPGAFDGEDVYEEDGSMVVQNGQHNQESFLDERSVGSQSEAGEDEPMDHVDQLEDTKSVSIMDQEMAGSFPEADNTADLVPHSQNEDANVNSTMNDPSAILRARIMATRSANTPSKTDYSTVDDWTKTLQATVSPKKQDRALLKSLIDFDDHPGRNSATANGPSLAAKRVVSDGRGFATSIDLMNSLFGQVKSPVKPQKTKGFEWPYAKRQKIDDIMSSIDRAYHQSFKPNWGFDGTLVYAAPTTTQSFGRSTRRTKERCGLLTVQKGGVISESRDIRFARFLNEPSTEFLKKHKSMTTISDVDQVPFAQLDPSHDFRDFLAESNSKDPAIAHENLCWELAHVLFDDIITVPEELLDVPNIIGRLRKDKLSSFWERVVEQASVQHVALARSCEEKALGSLTGHKVADACNHLVTGRDYHLATLVALIGTKASIQKDMRNQLNQWQTSSYLSEFSQPIRTIYEIIAGNVCVCSGIKGSPEDRIESFVIAKRFGLDWRQAFGLRLWYATIKPDTIEDSVERYLMDLAQDKETSKPLPWYVEQRIPNIWEDKNIAQREDVLWGLLKLYTYEASDLQAILRPENSRLSPLDYRFSWQLGLAFASFTGILIGEGICMADELTLSFASQLTQEGSWLNALFVLLHLSSPQARAKSIKEHLALHAKYINPDDNQTMDTLFHVYRIPSTWVWEAKALYVRSVQNDSVSEVVFLQNADAFIEAHRTLIKKVAPQAVIERDYTTLRQLLARFVGREHGISDWALGGQIYLDYLQLLHFEKIAGALDQEVLDRLLGALPSAMQESRSIVFLERVALETMAGVVAKLVSRLDIKGSTKLSKVLNLPLTEEKYLKHTVDLSLVYYRNLVGNSK